MPRYAKLCIKSWIKYFPDFELIQWNESNSDLSHPFLIEAVKQENWAFVSDFIRIQKLVEFGGIYLDTDMLFIKPFDLNLLKYDFFIGMENSNSLSAGVIGTNKGGDFINRVLDSYRKFSKTHVNSVTIPTVLNSVYYDFVNKDPVPGNLLGGIILEYPVFYPLPYKLRELHWRKFVAKDSMAVHLWAGSWLSFDKSSVFSRFISVSKYHISRFFVPQSFIKYAKNI